MNVFISCGKNKRNIPCKAEDMYIGQRFKGFLRWAKTKTTRDKIFILSAKYGLLRLDDWIEPYNYTLIGKSSEIKKKWGGMYLIKQYEKVLK